MFKFILKWFTNRKQQTKRRNCPHNDASGFASKYGIHVWCDDCGAVLTHKPYRKDVKWKNRYYHWEKNDY